MTEYHEIEFIPADWVERAASCPGLQVRSRTVSVPIDVDCPQRRKTDRGVPTMAIDEIERLLRAALLLDPLDHMERLLEAYNE
jgi:hypothetical protein